MEIQMDVIPGLYVLEALWTRVMLEIYNPFVFRQRIVELTERIMMLQMD